MKKHIRSLLLVILGIILGLGTAQAATIISSKNVTYENDKSTLSSTTVEGALDELYDKVEIIKSTTASKTDVVSGKKFVTSDGTLMEGTLDNSFASSFGKKMTLSKLCDENNNFTISQDTYVLYMTKKENAASYMTGMLIKKYSAGTYPCTNAAIGIDPDPGAGKACYRLSWS